LIARKTSIAWTRQVLDEAAANRVRNDDKNDGDGARLLQH
jgi:hypothetical protein